MNDFFLMRKNLFRKKLRAILLLFSIAIAFLIFGLLMAFNKAFYAGEDLASQNRLITMNKVNFTQPLPIAYVDRVRQVEGVEMATHLTWFGGYYRDGKNGLIMFSVDPETMVNSYPDNEMPDDQKKAFVSTRNGLMVGKATAARFGWKVGDHVPISSNIYSNKDGGHTWDFVVSAIFVNSKLGDATANVFLHYDLFNESVTFGQDHISFITVTTKDAKQNEQVIHRIDNLFANSAAETSTGTEGAFNKSFAEQMGNIKLIVSLVTGAAFVTILMIVGNTMVMAVRERTREIGVLKTLGFPEGRILKLVLGESFFLAFLGGTIGIGLATVLAVGLAAALSGFMPGFAIPGSVYAMAFGLMALLGLATGLAPALAAMRLNIITALGRR